MPETGHHHQPRHPIGVAAERTGLSPDVLRVWERRYGVVKPGRSGGKQRYYSDAEIERLRLLRQATLSGRSIRHVVSLSTDALASMVNEDAAERAKAPTTSPVASSTASSAAPSGATALSAAVCPLTVARAMNFATAFDAAGLSELLHHSLGTLGLPVFVDSVASPLLHDTDSAWRSGRVTAAVEHLVSATVRRMIIAGMEQLRTSADASSVVVAALPGETNEAEALLCAASAMVAGRRVTYLGVDLPAHEIAHATQATGARAVIVSTTASDSVRTVSAGVQTLRSRLPSDVTLYVAGHVADAAGQLAALDVHVTERVTDALMSQS